MLLTDGLRSSPIGRVASLGQGHVKPILILLALIGTGLHFAYSGIYSPLTNYSWAQLSQEQLPPLISFVNGHPIESIDRR